MLQPCELCCESKVCIVQHVALISQRLLLSEQCDFSMRFHCTVMSSSDVGRHGVLRDFLLFRLTAACLIFCCSADWNISIDVVLNIGQCVNRIVQLGKGCQWCQVESFLAGKQPGRCCRSHFWVLVGVAGHRASCTMYRLHDTGYHKNTTH